MSKPQTKIVGKLCVISVAISMIAGLSACSTSSTVKVAHAAPITYKIGEGSAKYASLTLPNTPRSLSRPYSAAPKAVPTPRSAIPYKSIPHNQGASEFNTQMVDRDLYKHQRVGKRYTVFGKSYTPKHQPDYDVTGIASFYGDKFHGKPTATGEIFNKNDITAAHKTLPLNSMLHVTNLENGKTLMVRLNDRGPFVGKRIIDLSEASALALGITTAKGLSQVRVRYVGPADPNAAGKAIAPPCRSIPQVVEAPRPAAPLSVPDYRPLRQQPHAQAPFTPPSYDPAPQEARPQLPTPIAPQAPTPVPNTEDLDGEGQITLTIKGPVHMATQKSDDDQPAWIDAVNRRRYKTQK